MTVSEKKKELRDRVHARGKKAPISYKNTMWQTDLRSQRFWAKASISALRSLLDSSYSWPSDFICVDKNNNRVTFTANESLVIQTMITDQVRSRRLSVRVLKDEINSFTTMEELTVFETREFPE